MDLINLKNKTQDNKTIGSSNLSDIATHAPQVTIYTRMKKHDYFIHNFT